MKRITAIHAALVAAELAACRIAIGQPAGHELTAASAAADRLERGSPEAGAMDMLLSVLAEEVAG